MTLTRWLSGALLACALQNAPALGLGDAEVASRLNQKLDARIELVSVKPGDVPAMQIRLAAPEIFESAGLPRPHHLSQLRFEAVSTGEEAGHIRITSTEPVREPFLSFIVEVQWPNGRLLREYTLLLNTP